MSNLSKTVIAVIIVTFMIYGLGALIEWEDDINKWHVATRAILGTLVFINLINAIKQYNTNNY